MMVNLGGLFIWIAIGIFNERSTRSSANVLGLAVLLGLLGIVAIPAGLGMIVYACWSLALIVTEDYRSSMVASSSWPDFANPFGGEYFQ
ncbi:MAG: hypothetical protein ACRD3J_30720 [Thermoanaerobaculia bacterium]